MECPTNPTPTRLSNLMTSLVIAIFLASVLGSLHCAGMCGAFLAMAVTTPVTRNGHIVSWRSHAVLQSSYHLGRLATYATLGVLAGALGSVVDLGASIAGVQRAAGVLAACTIVVFGGATLLRVWGLRVPKLPFPSRLQRYAIAGHRSAVDLPPMLRAGVIGLLTTLLPCGWLYAFVVTAAGTGRVGTGAIVMVVFWLGTLPLLVSLGAGLRTAAGRLGRYFPTLTAMLLITMGLVTLVQRMPLIGVLSPAAVAAHAGITPGPSLDPVSTISRDGALCCDGR